MAHSSAEYQREWYTKKKVSDSNWYARRKAKRQEWLQSENGKESYKKAAVMGAARLASTKSGAKRRGLAWELSDSHALELIRSSCVYCGKAPINGIDRKDNSQGYLPDNTVACCSQCNRAKHVQSFATFLAYLDRIVEYRNKK